MVLEPEKKSGYDTMNGLIVEGTSDLNSNPRIEVFGMFYDERDSRNLAMLNTNKILLLVIFKLNYFFSFCF